MSDALFKAVDDSKTEADFLEVLRGCAEADVKYRDRGGFTVRMAIAIEHDWPKAAVASQRAATCRAG